jgi:hypothetical protein
MSTDTSLPTPTLAPVHTKPSVTLSATEFRQRFFALLGSVLADPTEMVFVEHKDLAGRAMLVSESYRDYVRQLEALVASLLSTGGAASPPMRLAGSMTIVDDAEGVLAAARASAAEQSARKFDGL